jgi:hypothetical protein
MSRTEYNPEKRIALKGEGQIAPPLGLGVGRDSMNGCGPGSIGEF